MRVAREVVARQICFLRFVIVPRATGSDGSDNDEEVDVFLTTIWLPQTGDLASSQQ